MSNTVNSVDMVITSVVFWFLKSSIDTQKEKKLGLKFKMNGTLKIDISRQIIDTCLILIVSPMSTCLLDCVWVKLNPSGNEFEDVQASLMPNQVFLVVW
jgi:hypothetical protein